MSTRVITDPLKVASYWSGSETYFALEATVLRIRELRQLAGGFELIEALIELESLLLTNRTGSITWKVPFGTSGSPNSTDD